LTSMDKLKKVLSGNDDDNTDREGIMTEFSDRTTFSWSSRIKGFIACFVIGWIFSLLGSALIALPHGLVIFATFYTIGNVLSLASTCFLMGPINQLKKMFAPTRLIATLLMLLFMALTLMAAIWWKKSVLAVIFCLLQFLALVWYSISYIPYARTAIKNAFSACMG
ncbi:hypothetical protein BOX15_Mlig013861g1, partial [Macrostomum lignano]